MSASKTTISNFPLYRAAIIAGAVPIFILIFQPLGVSINSLLEIAIILGLAPLNFLVMIAVHRLPLTEGRMRGLIGGVLITAANILYLIFWNAGQGAVTITVKVSLVAVLSVQAIAIWQREYALKREVIELKARLARQDCSPIVFRGESDKEILRLTADTLHYVRANGNYVDVHFLKGAAPGSAMLRATLSNIADQAPDGVLMQCHRSFLVNLAAAHRLVSRGGKMEIEFPDGARAPVSRAFRDAIRAAAVS